MANDRTYSFAELALAALAGLGAATPFPFVILLGTALFEGPDLVDVLWILGAMTLAGLLLAGLVLRLQGGRPLLSTALLVVGSAAPSLAWFWLPPVYLLTVLIAVLALTTIRDRPMLKRVAI